MNVRTVTVPHFGLPILIELDAGTGPEEMDRAGRILTALAAADHDNGRDFARRFPFTCYSRNGDARGSARIALCHVSG